MFFSFLKPTSELSPLNSDVHICFKLDKRVFFQISVQNKCSGMSVNLCLRQQKTTNSILSSHSLYF